MVYQIPQNKVRREVGSGARHIAYRVSRGVGRDMAARAKIVAVFDPEFRTRWRFAAKQPVLGNLSGKQDDLFRADVPRQGGEDTGRKMCSSVS
jgi:hypothetical protein